MNNSSLKDIQNREDIKLLVDSFYQKIIQDDLIGHFFNGVIEIDWDKHYPLLYDFWETTLLGNIKYKGNPMLKHIELSRKHPIRPEHFERWLAHWKSTVEKNFVGTKADEAIQRATLIGELMKHKIQQHRSSD